MVIGKSKFIISLLLAGALMPGCKEEEAPDNPYDAVNYSQGGEDDSLPDPSSITGLHKNIFSPKCAVPGCHDGTFEPDFRTVQSSFSTLLYQPVNKLTLDSSKFFSYRVLPDDVSNSFLMERLTTPTSEYMPSNSVRLSAAEINQVEIWINNGCPDVNGNLPQRPNLPPNFVGYQAYTTSFVRLDTARLGGIIFNPFLVSSGSTIVLPVVAMDTADGSFATQPQDFTVHELKLSTSKDNFSSSTVVNMTWLSPFPFPVWQATINTLLWPVGTTVFFRTYFNDGFQLNPAEFPRTSSLDYYKTYCSFQIQ
jgi:hypothetical protein